MRKILFYFLSLFLWSCAIQVAPTGGDKDTKAPELLGSEPKMFQTGYNGHEIVLNFDEYVQVKDASNSLVVSPLLKQQPIVKIKGKSVIISFEGDTLLPNTTYTMNFGSSLVDVNEGNAKEDFQFVFSTGDHIDSLQITGKVINAKDLRADGGYIVMLYHENKDSLPYLSRPDYFCKTAKDGSFKVRNISPGKYKIIALKDGDNDYKYSPALESIAFSDSVVEDGNTDVLLKLFSEHPKAGIAKTTAEYSGKASVYFTRPVTDKGIQWLSDPSKVMMKNIAWSATSDTLSFYYMDRDADTLSFKLNAFPKDTVIIRLLKNVQRQGRGAGFSVNTDRQGDLNYWQPVGLSANKAISSVDTSLMVLTEDSAVIPIQTVISDSLSGKILLQNKWKQKKTYRLTLFPRSVLSMFFEQFTDTIRLSWNTKTEKEFGSLNVTLDSLPKGKFILQLVDADDKVFYEQQTDGNRMYPFTLLDPKSYRVKLIADSNENKKWDGGDYLNHIQPEEVYYYPENITVRANWDVDVKWLKPVK